MGLRGRVGKQDRRAEGGLRRQGQAAFDLGKENKIGCVVAHSSLGASGIPPVFPKLSTVIAIIILLLFIPCCS